MSRFYHIVLLYTLLTGYTCSSIVSLNIYLYRFEYWHSYKQCNKGSVLYLSELIPSLTTRNVTLERVYLHGPVHSDLAFKVVVHRYSCLEFRFLEGSCASTQEAVTPRGPEVRFPVFDIDRRLTSETPTIIPSDTIVRLLRPFRRSLRGPHMHYRNVVNN